VVYVVFEYKIDFNNIFIFKNILFILNMEKDKSVVSKTKLTIDEEKYINSLDEKEIKAYEIAKTHLGTTFHLMKSNGFIEWKNKSKDKE
jgi:competence protein ComGC